MWKKRRGEEREGGYGCGVEREGEYRGGKRIRSALGVGGGGGEGNGKVEGRQRGERGV